MWHLTHFITHHLNEVTRHTSYIQEVKVCWFYTSLLTASLHKLCAQEQQKRKRLFEYDRPVFECCSINLLTGETISKSWEELLHDGFQMGLHVIIYRLD